MNHVSGGLALLEGANRLSMLLGPPGESLRVFSLHPRRSVLSLFVGHKGLRVLGRNTYCSADELRDPVTDRFILAANKKKDRGCLALTQQLHWCGVSNALVESDRRQDATLARRIASQIFTCTRRLERLSLAYRTVVSVVSWHGLTSSNSITSDKYAQHIGNEYRSLLSELYSLRDAVGAATWRFQYGQSRPYRIRKLKALVLNDQSGIGRLIADSMFREDGTSIVNRMSLYRNIGLHSIGSSNPVFSDCYQRCISEGPLGPIPYLVFPIFDDIDRLRAIERDASRGTYKGLGNDEAERFLGKPEHADALEFSYDCYVRLLRIAESVALDTALKSRLMTMRESDIIELTVTEGDGRVTRMKRDAATGKLVAY